MQSLKKQFSELEMRNQHKARIAQDHHSVNYVLEFLSVSRNAFSKDEQGRSPRDLLFGKSIDLPQSAPFASRTQ